MRTVFALCVFFMIVSCNNNAMPSDIIKPAKMQDIFWDLIRADLLAQQDIKKDSLKNLKSLSLAYAEKVFAIHNTDKIKFEKSLSFYEHHPTLMRNIFDSLNTNKYKNNFPEVHNAKFIKDHVPIQKAIP